MRGVEIPCHSTNQARGLKVKGKNMPAGLSVDSGAKAGWRSKAAWRGRGGEGQGEAAAAPACEPVTFLQPGGPEVLGQGHGQPHTAASDSCVFRGGAWPDSCLPGEMP